MSYDWLFAFAEKENIDKNPPARMDKVTIDIIISGRVSPLLFLVELKNNIILLFSPYLYPRQW